ncbi:unnamed protein product [Pleuronectes platessa]|uniref:Uncharacterized protein n=1 Tax=Pleuronectes platessa TaxID=8262 RepID=A0A9N7U434_PLEPL|nr:unnamed protein product [Pleuronectes platessa]
MWAGQTDLIQDQTWTQTGFTFDLRRFNRNFREEEATSDVLTQVVFICLSDPFLSPTGKWRQLKTQTTEEESNPRC